MSRPRRSTRARGALSIALLASGAAVLAGCDAKPSSSTAPATG